MQTDRLFGIVYLLLNKKKTTAVALAEYFGVSKRTILRDFDTLTLAGIPIYTAKGRGGGVSLSDGFVLDKTALSEEERRQILLALRTLAPTRYPETEGVISKLGALFSVAGTDWIEVDFSRWGNASFDREKFGALKDAVTGSRALSFTYVNSCGKTSERKVYPLKLVFKSNAWYVQAWCLSKKNYRTFKVNRILGLKVLAETFYSRDFSPPPLEEDAAVSDSFVRLKLSFSPEAAYRVFDEFPPGQVAEAPDGSLIVTAEMPEDDWVYGYLLSFGPAVRVLEPQNVRRALLRRAEEIKKIYSENIR